MGKKRKGGDGRSGEGGRREGGKLASPMKSLLAPSPELLPPAHHPEMLLNITKAHKPRSFVPKNLSCEQRENMLKPTE